MVSERCKARLQLYAVVHQLEAVGRGKASNLCRVQQAKGQGVIRSQHLGGTIDCMQLLLLELISSTYSM
jgi:hypothetical protein